ncbi:transposase [Streptomyces sp. DR7-3]|uniref:transposase n=1 Tax=Streptomyces malaysiensis TaxID=92644 RepID=UPI0020441D90|nr:transposase [Streptomyces sp. DR7-3]MCM3809286.1 transposase [Streptomyces sp. DR7-3]
MASRKRVYDAEFRDGAVRIVTETGKPIPEVAEDQGIDPGTLHSWVSRARRNGSPSSDRPMAEPSGGRLRESERAELERLRAEAREKDKRIRELEMERDVCKVSRPCGEVAEADPAVAVRVVSRCKAEQKIPHRVACRALGVPESWYCPPGGPRRSGCCCAHALYLSVVCDANVGCGRPADCRRGSGVSPCDGRDNR